VPAEQSHHDPELKAEVPALQDFHSVIYPLWHQAWPDRDYEMMKRLLPKVLEHVATLESVELPGILRDRKAAWDDGVASLKKVAARYQAAAQADDAETLTATVEQLHGEFESLVRLVRPPLKELNAYHVMLYRIYHHYLPEKRPTELASAAKELVARAQELEAAELPKRLSEKAEIVAPAFTELARLSAELEASMQEELDWDEVTAAVDAVHAQYQKVEGLLE
jgi:hypothetical protein